MKEECELYQAKAESGSDVGFKQIQREISGQAEKVLDEQAQVKAEKEEII